MRLRRIEGDPDNKEVNDVRLSMSREETRAFNVVVRGIVRRAVSEKPDDGKSKIGTLIDKGIVEDFRRVRRGLFRTRVTMGEGTLDTIRSNLLTFPVTGIPDELAYNPEAEPIRLAQIAETAGEMAAQISAFIDPVVMPEAAEDIPRI